MLTAKMTDQSILARLLHTAPGLPKFGYGDSHPPVMSRNISVTRRGNVTLEIEPLGLTFEPSPSSLAQSLYP